jgi:hypothetical protein
VTRKRDEAGLCNVAKGRAGYYIIIIKKPRNLAEKSRMILSLEGDYTKDNYAAGTRPGCHRTLLARGPVKPRSDGQQSTRLNFLQSEPWINILTIRVPLTRDYVFEAEHRTRTV